MSHRSNPFRKLKRTLTQDPAVHAAGRHRHATAATRTYGWATFMGWFQPETAQPETEPAVDRRPAAAPAPPAHGQKLPPLPPGSMAQRSTGHYQPLPPVSHTYRGGLVADADLLNVAERVKATLRPAFQLNIEVPLFRDDAEDWEKFDETREKRLRWMQSLTEGRRDVHGENLGNGQSPKTLIMSPVLCERFSDNTSVMQAVSR